MFCSIANADVSIQLCDAIIIYSRTHTGVNGLPEFRSNTDQFITHSE